VVELKEKLLAIGVDCNGIDKSATVGRGESSRTTRCGTRPRDSTPCTVNAPNAKQDPAFTIYILAISTGGGKFATHVAKSTRFLL